MGIRKGTTAKHPLRSRLRKSFSLAGEAQIVSGYIERPSRVGREYGLIWSICTRTTKTTDEIYVKKKSGDTKSGRFEKDISHSEWISWVNDLTQHSDIGASRHTAEGVYQSHKVLSCIGPVWPEDHQALPLHQVAWVAIYLSATEEPCLLLHHSSQQAVLQGEPLTSFFRQRGLRAQTHILEVFCERGGEKGWWKR